MNIDMLNQGSTKLIQGNIHTTKTMTEYNTGWSSHLLNVSLFVVSYWSPIKSSALASWCPARNVMSWYDPSIAA